MNRNVTGPQERIELNTGRAMPVIGLGTWYLTNDTAGTVEEALRLGYRVIDTSRDYGTQPGIGEALRRTDVPREDVFLVAKVEEDEDSYEATVGNLDEMAQEYADLVLIHRPPPDSVGADLWRGLVRAREEGLARDIGVSNYSIHQLDALIDRTGDTPAVNQIEWTPFGWSQEMLDHARELGIVIQAYSPLTRGDWLDHERLRIVAAALDRTPAQVLLRWGLQMGVVPLPKANQLPHLRENLGAFDFALDEAAMQALSQLNEHHSALGATLEYV